MKRKLNNISSSSSNDKFLDILKNRTVNHKTLPQLENNIKDNKNEPFSFVVAADTQFGIISGNKEWIKEMEYSEMTVKYINNLNPKPAFVTVCGDLVDMEPTMFSNEELNREDCIKIQTKQNDDFKRIWGKLNQDIALLCLCGNHDVGNKPTKESLSRYTSQFGDDYYAFWHKNCYFICLNSNMYNDNTYCQDEFNEQQLWLEERLIYARGNTNKNMNANRVFIFSHHPWFLFNEFETKEELEKGKNYLPSLPSNNGGFIKDNYFSIKSFHRNKLMELFKLYKVDGCFSGHYHQNLISRSSFGMPMIITGPVCNWILESSLKDVTKAENQTLSGGIRLVNIDDSLNDDGLYYYLRFFLLSLY